MAFSAVLATMLSLLYNISEVSQIFFRSSDSVKYATSLAISPSITSLSAVGIPLLLKVALALFRILVQKEIGYKSEQPGYAGLIDEAQNYMVVQVHLVLWWMLVKLLPLSLS